MSLLFGNEDCEILLNLLANRDDKDSIIIITNLDFDRWSEIFKYALLYRIMAYRLVYKGHILKWFL